MSANESLMKYLNLGCGNRFHPEWTNLDFVSKSPQVRAHDLRENIPYPDMSFDVVYLSHVLEHFTKEGGAKLLRDCHRVLSCGGTIRVVVPDLERIARLYLETLDKAAEGAEGWAAKYDWIMLELYDQTVRDRSAGGMLDFVRKSTAEELQFVQQRIGGELRPMLNESRKLSDTEKLEFNECVSQLRYGVHRKLLRLLLGREGIRAYDLGRFRLSGEVHYWMYDRFGLGRSLERVGFLSPRKVEPAESAVPRWTNFNLDTERDGSIYKPDSLYMEAVKP